MKWEGGVVWVGRCEGKYWWKGVGGRVWQGIAAYTSLRTH